MRRRGIVISQSLRPLRLVEAQLQPGPLQIHSNTKWLYQDLYRPGFLQIADDRCRVPSGVIRDCRHHSSGLKQELS